jgi:hypothetical protein
MLLALIAIGFLATFVLPTPETSDETFTEADFAWVCKDRGIELPR